MQVRARGRARGRESQPRAAENQALAPESSAELLALAEWFHFSAFQKPEWEITRERAGRWLEWNFEELRDGCRFLELIGPLDEAEVMLLLWDLDQYVALWERYSVGRGSRPPHLAEYLRPGREDWGLVGRLIRAWEAEDAE
jgi:hypothetical protein